MNLQQGMNMRELMLAYSQYQDNPLKYDITHFG